MRSPDNHPTYVRKEPVQLTFGMLRQEGRGFTVICRKCGHRAFIEPKAMRYLALRLRDDLKLADATDDLFRCSECSYDRVSLSPEPKYSGRGHAVGGPLSGNPLVS